MIATSETFASVSTTVESLIVKGEVILIMHASMVLIPISGSWGEIRNTLFTPCYKVNKYSYRA